MSGLVRVRRVTAAALLRRREEVGRVYGEVFAEPPWCEGPKETSAFVQRLPDDVLREGCVAALAFGSGRDRERVVGFATAWTTPAVFPTGRSYAAARAALGEKRTRLWLCGAREIDEIAVAPSARGAGVGTALLGAVTTDAPDGRCWLLTSAAATGSLRFYRRLGWARATCPAPEGAGPVVLLGPGHPRRGDIPD
ncbi:GNAT family N-acetyltransferase [Streptomyces sp. NRRL F-5630]|uniref:GNAT family N-acetyltransferase n=1 Tax=Streptomyces sp. NRRL F-5630 TaxID=1463864 RepID=UPI000D141828|nr:GNAT family N-acetyltransferase [Streptomyces sp. NRRL F-5630]